MNTKFLKNNQIKIVDLEYKKLIFYIFRLILKHYPGIPLETEDLYYEFLYLVPDIFTNFKQDKADFKTYLVLRAKAFARTKCRCWMKKNHTIMNFSKPLTYDVADPNNDNETLEQIDISSLNNSEKMIYHYYFVANMSVVDICQKMNVTQYGFKVIFNNLKSKLYHHNFKKN